MPTKEATVKSTKKKKVVKKKAIRKVMEPPVKSEKAEAIKAAVKKVGKQATKKKAPPKKKVVKKKAAAPKPRKPRKRGMYYIDRKELLQDVIDSKEEGKMNDGLATKLVLLTTKYARAANFARYCVDDQTQALTKRGWLNYDEIATTDTILSYDCDTKQLKWSPVTDVFTDVDYSGEMHKLDTHGLDALVTPNHKFVSKERGLIPVEDIICNEHIILMGDHISDNPNINGTLKYSNSFVETVGWAITEGHYVPNSKTKRCIQIFQNIGPHADSIRNCLMEESIHFKEYNFKDNQLAFYCTGETISRIYDTVAPNKVISAEFILSLSHEQRMLLITTMVNADGWIRPSGGMSYAQNDKNHVDAFLMLCTISGLTTSAVPMEYKTPPSKKNPDGGTSKVFSVNIYVTPKLCCKSERIDFHGGRPSSGGRRNQKSNTPTHHYTGPIWCPQTEYGTFVCRRNKYIYVTGNTYNDDMQGYAMMMLVKSWASFKPEKSDNPFAFYTQCIKNSFKQFLNQEKRHRTIRDALLVDSGMNPSYAYETEYKEKAAAKEVAEAS